jgi:acyl carrier protein
MGRDRMSDGSTQQIVESIVHAKFRTLGLEPPPDTSFELRAAGLTSLQLVQLVFSVEDGCGITLPDGMVTPGNFRSIDSIVAMVRALAPGIKTTGSPA